jgi:hypothetical protein
MAVLCQPCGLSMALGRTLPALRLLTRSVRVSNPRIRRSIRTGKSRSAKCVAITLRCGILEHPMAATGHFQPSRPRRQAQSMSAAPLIAVRQQTITLDNQEILLKLELRGLHQPNTMRKSSLSQPWRPGAATMLAACTWRELQQRRQHRDLDVRDISLSCARSSHAEGQGPSEIVCGCPQFSIPTSRPVKVQSVRNFHRSVSRWNLSGGGRLARVGSLG